MHNCTVVMNLKNFAPTTYWDYDFESLAVVNDQLWGASPDGLYQLDVGDTDAGNTILAKFRTLITDFGDEHLKRIRYIVLGLEASGDMSITLKCDETIEKTYTVSTDLVYNFQHGVKKTVDSTPLGRYWTVEIANSDGVDFSIDKIILGLIVTSRKFALRHRYGKAAIYFPDTVVSAS